MFSRKTAGDSPILHRSRPQTAENIPGRPSSKKPGEVRCRLSFHDLLGELRPLASTSHKPRRACDQYQCQLPCPSDKRRRSGRRNHPQKTTNIKTTTNKHGSSNMQPQNHTESSTQEKWGTGHYGTRMILVQRTSWRRRSFPHHINKLARTHRTAHHQVVTASIDVHSLLL